jgi:hypothetical protein
MSLQDAFNPLPVQKPRAPVFSGFGEGIANLNKTLSGSLFMTRFDEGRAYRIPRGTFSVPKIHIDHIHALPVAEKSPHNVLESLSESDERLGTIYMGTAGLLNFGFIGAMRPGAAILFDINPAQTMFWNRAFDLLAQTNSPEEFMDAVVESSPDIYKKLTKLYGLAGKNFDPLDNLTPRLCIRRAFRNSPLEDWRQRGFEYGYQWMKDKMGYEHLREMAQQKAIGALTIDVLDRAAWAQLSDHLHKNVSGAPPHVRTMYISNIESFVWDQAIDFVGRTMKKHSRQSMHDAISHVLEAGRYEMLNHEGGAPRQWDETKQSYSSIFPAKPIPASL